MPNGLRLVRTCPKSTGTATVTAPDGGSLRLDEGGKAELLPASLSQLDRPEEESWGAYAFDLMPGTML